MQTVEGGLGRNVPTDWRHVERFALQADPLSELMPAVEKVLPLPAFWYKGEHDQGHEGACEGFGNSLMMTIINTLQQGRLHRYNPWWLWDRAKEIDEWADTNPGDSNGTSGRAACDVLRTLGHVRVQRRRESPPDPSQGIRENRWATSVDQMRAVAGVGLPMAIGVNWYGNFDRPQQKANGKLTEFVIGEGDLGGIRGGHCICVFGASDRRQAFKLANSWGRGYPLVWLPYATMERLIREDGEVALVTDI